MAMTKEVLLTNVRNDRNGAGDCGYARNDKRQGIAGRARNDGGGGGFRVEPAMTERMAMTEEMAIAQAKKNML